MKQLIIALSMACGIHLICTQSAQAARVIDQLQPILDSSISLAVGGSSEQKLAQTFTTDVAGVLKGVYLPIACADGRLRLSINNVEAGVPGTVEYSTKQIRPARITNQITTFRYFGFPDNIPVNVGDEYAIVITNATGSCGISNSPIGDTYAGGSGFFDARPNPPGWIAFEETETRLDLPFMVQIKTP